MNLTKLLFIVFLVGAANTLQAQTREDYWIAANNYFEQGDYYSATIYFEKYLNPAASVKTKQTNNPFAVKKAGSKATAPSSAVGTQKAHYMLAESYRLLNDWGNAEKHYAEAVKTETQQHPEVLYWYGVSLRANKKVQEANQAFEKYLATNDTRYAAQAKREVANYQFTQQQMARKDTALFTIKKAQVNKTGATYAAAINNGKLFFTSTRPDSTGGLMKGESPFENKIYQAVYSNEMPGEAEKLELPKQSGWEQGIPALLPSGNKIFFTRWQKNGKDLTAAIYSSDKTATGWSEPVKLQDGVNAEGYNSQQPFVTADGKYLLFSSNMPGTLGKFDIWIASLDANGTVTAAPKNAGATINTADDEESPFYHNASQTLVFASNGRTGLGGFDLITSKGNFDKGWSEPVNAGYPVNSVKDDLYFTTNSNDGLFTNALVSSDRYSACCLELLSVNKVYKKYITGTVTDCKTGLALPDANVVIKDKQGNSISTQATTANGAYSVTMPGASFKALTITADKQGYSNASIQTESSYSDADSLVNTAFCLVPDEPIIETEPPSIPSNPMFVYFDFDKSFLRKDAMAVLDSLAAVLKKVPGLKIEIGGYTDGKGAEEYNVKLSENRANACLNYLVKNKGIEADRISIKSYGECCPVGKETTEDGKDNPDGRQLNRRAEFKIIGY